MRLEELHKLILRGESEILEFTKTTPQRSEDAKRVCVLLNGEAEFVLLCFSGKRKITPPSYFFAKEEVPEGEKRPKIRPKIRPKLEPESSSKEVLNLFCEFSFFKSEIAKKLGYKHNSDRLESILSQLLEECLVAYPLHEKRNSNLQRYQILGEQRRPESRPKLRPESGPDSRPESIKKEMLIFLKDGRLSKSEKVKKLGNKNVSGGLKRVLTHYSRNTTPKVPTESKKIGTK